MAHASPSTVRSEAGAPVALYVAVLVAAVATWFGRPVVQDTLGLWALGAQDNPYFIPAQALQLYVLTPLASLATSVFFLSPGLLLAAVFGRTKSLAMWLLSGLALSILVLVAVTTAYQLATGTVAKGETFFWLVAATVGGAFAVAVMAVIAGRGNTVEVGDDGGDLVFAGVLFWLGLVLLAPKFYWENFSGDGSGSLQFARNFVNTLWPFWAPEAGTIQKAPGLTSFLFVIPESWFVRLWGEWEYSVRVPMMMYFLLLYPVLVALIRAGRFVTVLVPDQLLLIGMLLVYSLAVIYSGGYNPYFGDSPMPAARETLALALFMGYVLCFDEDRRFLMAVCGILGHLTIPTGGLWLLLVPAAVFLTWRPIPWNRLFFAGFVLVLAGMISVGVPRIIEAVGLPYPGGEFNAKAVIDRLRFVALVDFYRFAMLVIPCGILPALFLLTWKRQDQVARTLTVVTVVFFFFFYFQGYRVLLHHFIPVMMAPIVVFFRSPILDGPRGGQLRLLAVLSLLLATILAWPKEMKLHDFDRHIGTHLQTRGPVFEDGTPGPGDRFRTFDPAALDVAHHLLGKLFPIGWTEQDAQERFYGAPLVWWFYSEYPKDGDQPVNYVIQPVADATEADGRLFEEYMGYGLYIRDEDLYQQHYTTTLPTNTGAQIFVTTRDIMFGRGSKWGDRIVIDLVPIARSILGMKEQPDDTPAATTE